MCRRPIISVYWSDNQNKTSGDFVDTLVTSLATFGLNFAIVHFKIRLSAGIYTDHVGCLVFLVGGIRYRMDRPEVAVKPLANW